MTHRVLKSQVSLKEQMIQLSADDRAHLAAEHAALLEAQAQGQIGEAVYLGPVDLSLPSDCEFRAPESDPA